MKIFPKYSSSRNQGFTLIELLVVISMISLLASLILVNLSGARRDAAHVALVANFKQISKALELYYEDNGSYPNFYYDNHYAAADPHSWESFLAVLTPYVGGSSLARLPQTSGVYWIAYTTSLITGSPSGTYCAFATPGQGYLLFAGFANNNKYTLGDQGIGSWAYEIYGGQYTKGVYSQDPITGVQTCG